MLKRMEWILRYLGKFCEGYGECKFCLKILSLDIVNECRDNWNVSKALMPVSDNRAIMSI